jgi:YidC/Oxa1 family membrane protein insertase
MSLDFIAIPTGWLMKLFYDILLPINTKYLSAYSISLILITLVIKFLLLPLTLKQTKSMKRMQELNPQISELKEKYGKDPQTFQRKQMELYKEVNYNPMSGCLPMLIQLPLIITFFNVIQNPVKYVFNGDQAAYDIMNKSFLWIKNLAFSEGQIISEGIVNGLNIGFNIPFIGMALPILAGISAYTTYLTTKMTASAQPTMADEQAKTTQNMMSIMMPIMIFFMSIKFPSGLALYWVIGNIFQLGQQWIILNSSKKLKD